MQTCSIVSKEGFIYEKNAGFSIILVLLVITPVHSLAWYGGTFHPNGDEGNVHYEDTKEWAMDVGMDKFWAVQTASHCDSVDVLQAKSKS